MAPAQLELFKFGLCKLHLTSKSFNAAVDQCIGLVRTDVFIPIAAMLHYGDPDWYEQYVGPLRSNYRKDDLPQIAPAQTPSELKDQLARMREERLKKRDERITSTAGSTLGNAESSTV
ncbi:BQ2448_2557 [Microbotryum intermedium]|uniref:BQ2448_2557 protein n=1 Tax=Microbotryum intermedium TaxID=269621 RepID=A0A238F8S9_9BASI|nr:BQ2448_2557 [Microbotryum intermedium]